MNEAKQKIEAAQKVLMKQYKIISNKIFSEGLDMDAEEEGWHKGYLAGLVDAMGILESPLTLLQMELEDPEK